MPMADPMAEPMAELQKTKMASLLNKGLLIWVL
jgi:hypothetical protein